MRIQHNDLDIQGFLGAKSYTGVRQLRIFHEGGDFALNIYSDRAKPWKVILTDKEVRRLIEVYEGAQRDAKSKSEAEAAK